MFAVKTLHDTYLATGVKSYPQAGSAGDGFTFAEPHPSLAPVYAVCQ
ncbi:MAG TPA: hypothetical protein O0X23_02085 [Methanocorpusculum sp.]|nr:hypothetical protein [Methanocorpusculum sp.]